MSNIKEKSAVGAATPATEKDIKNIPTKIISDGLGKIKKNLDGDKNA